jgi:hypothetical protein
MYTTMSPGEMTQDPMFVFNKDLPLVAKDHVADGVVKCSGAYEYADAPVEITLETGQTYLFDQSNNALDRATSTKLPAAARVEQLKSTGAPSIIKDNAGEITKILSAGALASGRSGGVVSVPKPNLGGFGCVGCSMTNSPVPPVQRGGGEGLAYALVGLGFFGYRRWVGRKRR